MYTNFRGCSTTRSGSSFTFETRLAVWRKGKVIEGYDSNSYRKDSCGVWMSWSDYGNVQSNVGWEIDHVRPVAKGGGDSLDNLQPLQWSNNRYKSDNYPNWSCKISA